MPIEFRCTGRQKLLRTPNESAGRQARCPDCGAIVQVPAGVAPPNLVKPAATASPASSTAEPNLFADLGASAGATHSSTGDADAANPYAAPAPSAGWEAASPFGRQGELRHQRVNFGEVFNQTWAIYSDNLGVLVLAALVVVGLGVAAYMLFIFLFVGFMMASGMGQPGAEPEAQMLVVFGLIGLVFLVGAAIIGSWIQAGLTKLFTAIGRGDAAGVDMMFKGSADMWRLLGVNVLVMLIIFGVQIVCTLPGQLAGEPLLAIGGMAIYYIIYLMVILLTLLAAYFIVDRKEGVTSALSLSMRYMKGNKLTTFALMLVGGVIAIAVTLFTCGLGALFVTPYLWLMVSVIYLMATGQPTAVERRYRR